MTTKPPENGPGFWFEEQDDPPERLRVRIRVGLSREAQQDREAGAHDFHAMHIDERPRIKVTPVSPDPDTVHTCRLCGQETTYWQGKRPELIPICFDCEFHGNPKAVGQGGWGYTAGVWWGWRYDGNPLTAAIAQLSLVLGILCREAEG